MSMIKLFVPVSLFFITPCVMADINQDVLNLQHEWAQANYNLHGKQQDKAFKNLINRADNVVKTYPDRAESWIWRGIIKSSYAGIEGGLGALSLAKASKKDLEKALSINDKALSGSAYTSLGALYFKVPGWPIGFGDDDKAETMLKKALAMNPDGIDSNFFYAEYLEDEGQYKKAEQYLLKAQQAPARPQRPLADKGRHHEIQVELKKVKAKLEIKTTSNANFIN